MAPPAEATAHAGPGETWQRLVLAPGIELHVRDQARPDLRERVEQLIAFARALFHE
jgi:hypothetical protein